MTSLRAPTRATVHRVVASPLTGTDLTAGLAVPAASVVSRAVFIAGR